MENEIKFILNYSTDNREIRSILKENRIFGNLCSSIRVNGGEFTFAKFINKDLEDIKNLSLSNRNFNIKGLTEGDIGILKEKSEEETILYKIKVTRLYDSSFSNGEDLELDENIVIKNKIIEHIVEVTGKPFRFIEFDALVYCDDFEKLPTKGIASTLSSIKDDKILKELENLNWKNFKESI